MANKIPLSDEIVRKIRQIEIYTRRLLSGSLVGDTRSAIKGTGFEFDQIREYQPGDDVRFIDWNASARNNSLLVKQYIEERSRTILLAVDISQSGSIGSTEHTKHDIVAQVASALALVAGYGNDRIGLLLFSDEVEYFLPPGRGRFHVRTVMQQVFGYTPKKTKTNISSVLARLAQLKAKDGIVFLISDFIDDDFQTYLPIVSRMYDVIALRCLDPIESSFPAVGFITIEDIENGELVTLDARKSKSTTLHSFFSERILQQDMLFKKYGIDLIDISDNRSFIADIIRFFRRRMRY